MARGSFSKTVARAAASGGSKGYKAQAPRGWYMMLSLIVIGGFALIGYSRYEHNYVPPAVPPTAADHWYAALGFDVCGTVEPALAANPNISSVGIRTFGNGIIDIDPGAVSKPSLFTGKHATLGNFVAHYKGLVLSSSVLGLPNPAHAASSSVTTTTSIKTPGAKKKAKTTSTSSTTTTTAAPLTKPLVANGQTCTPSLGSERGAGRLLTEVWASPTAKGKIYKGNPNNLRLYNGQMITLGFVPKTVTSLPEPNSRGTLISDIQPNGSSGAAAQSKLKKALESTTTAAKSTSSVTKSKPKKG